VLEQKDRRARGLRREEVMRLEGDARAQVGRQRGRKGLGELRAVLYDEPQLGEAARQLR
jgi:hypothetical protein